MRVLMPVATSIVVLFSFASSPAFSQAESISRAGAIQEQSPTQPNPPAAPNASLVEGFEGTFPPAGWIVRNQSTTIGTNTNCWNQFTGATPWVAHGGNNQAGANFNCTSGNNTISGWLLTSQITGLANGDLVSFWTRKGSPDSFPDRLELRLCLDTTPDSCGAFGSTGTGSAAVGDFTTVVLSVNPTLVTGVYPTTYAQFSAALSGLPAGPNNGRLAFRYFVTSGGPSGANSDIISIDDISVGTPTSADLAITKTDGVATAVPGGSVTYTITGSNVGPDPVTGATIADTFPANETCTWTCVGAGGGTCTASGSGNISDLVNLPAGASSTYTASCAIAPAATGSLSNTATITASTADPVPGNNTATDTDTLTPQADLAITKTDGVTSAVPGGNVTYTIFANNAGPSDAPSSTVADTFPASLTCTWTCVGAGGGTCTGAGSGDINDLVNLPVGGSTTYTASCAISAAASGTLSNTATVTAAAGVTDLAPGNNSATDTDTLTPMADLAITKTDGVTSVMPGDNVTYTIVASNAGPSNAPASTVADTFPASLTCTWTCIGSGGGACTASGSGNINDLVNLPVGGSTTYTANCAISAAASGTLSNTATVSAATGVTDPTPGNNSATDADTVVRQADLSISKTDGVISVNAGSSLIYTIVSSNAGPQAANAATVADTFPAGLTCTWTCAGTGGGTCSAAGSGNINDSVNLPIGASVTHSASCAVSAAIANGTVISNTATVTAPAGVTDPDAGNNSATDTTTVIAGSSISGTKTVSGTFAPGGSIVYTIALSNAGPGNQADNPGDEFVDVLPAQISFVSVIASSGAATESGGTVYWNGPLAAAANVTITIDATVNSNASGQINNQGSINYDSNGDGANDATALTDNPAAPGAADPTGFAIYRELPTLGPIGLILLALGLIAIRVRRDRAIRR